MLVWHGLTGDVDPSVGRQAMWLYLAFALLVLPILVPVAIRAVEPTRAGAERWPAWDGWAQPWPAPPPDALQ